MNPRKVWIVFGKSNHQTLVIGTVGHINFNIPQFLKILKDDLHSEKDVGVGSRYDVQIQLFNIIKLSYLFKHFDACKGVRFVRIKSHDKKSEAFHVA